MVGTVLTGARSDRAAVSTYRIVIDLQVCPRQAGGSEDPALHLSQSREAGRPGEDSQKPAAAIL